MGVISAIDNTGIPSHKQIITFVEEAILNGAYKHGGQLPSVNGIRNSNWQRVSGSYLIMTPY